MARRNNRDRSEWVRGCHALCLEQKQSGLSMAAWLRENRQRVDDLMDASVGRSKTNQVASFDPNNQEHLNLNRVWHGPGQIGGIG